MDDTDAIPGNPADGRADQPNAPQPATRRQFLLWIGVGLNALAGVLLGVPILGYILSAAGRKAMKDDLGWISLGTLSQFPEGETRLASYRNPFVRPWDGKTADIPCYVRHVAGGTYQVFAINCAHLGCPVRWFPQSQLFMCPCHGGAYYADGSRASGPPPRGLFEYDFKLEKGELWIKGGQIPTLSQGPSVAGVPCDQQSAKTSSCA